MNISKINTFNFGLLKTPAYKNVEIDLIRRAQAEGKERKARFLSDKIGQKIPNGVLDIDAFGENFVLTTNDKGNVSTYTIQEIITNNPTHTLFNLNKNLSKISLLRN